jgi:hypothetical protein
VLSRGHRSVLGRGLAVMSREYKSVLSRGLTGVEYRVYECAHSWVNG